MFQANTHTLLCRTPVAGSDDDSLQEEVEAVVNGIVEHSLPATEQCLNTCIQMYTGTRPGVSAGY